MGKENNQRTKQDFVRGRAPNSALVTKEMTIKEVLKKYPEAASVFIEYGLHCIACSFAQEETIGEAVKVHQINIEEFLEDLNEVVNKIQPRKK